MKWPAVVRFENSDELEVIESKASWDNFLPSINVDCELIGSDGTVCNITVNSNGPSSMPTDKTINVEAAVELARRHMAAQAHCCVSKFNAPSVEAVITALVQLED